MPRLRRRLDVLAHELLADRGARELRDVGDPGDRQRDGRQREVPEPVGEAHAGAEHREPAEIDGEDGDEHDGGDERGRREPDARADGDRRS